MYASVVPSPIELSMVSRKQIANIITTLGAVIFFLEGKINQYLEPVFPSGAGDYPFDTIVPGIGIVLFLFGLALWLSEGKKG